MQKKRPTKAPDNSGDQRLRLDQWLPYRLFIIAARVAEPLADYYGPRYGLSQAAWRILATVGDKPGMSARQIRHAAGLDQFATSRAIAQLCELGYAERNAAERDKRRAEVHLTRQGQTVLDDLTKICLSIENELWAGLSEKQRGELNALLDVIDKSSVGIASRGLPAIAGDAPAGTVPDER